MTKLHITSKCDWTEEKLRLAWGEISIIAKEELRLDPDKDLYVNQFEIVSSEQMIDAYASIGMPVNYNHWSFGKDFLKTSESYKAGNQGLALELVINSSPCINYMMEDNDLVSQVMVMAHAGVGHNAVFKNNECFKQWTNAESIIDYMIFAKEYIKQCEDRYGPEEVGFVLDAAHTLAPHGVDKFKRNRKPKISEEDHLKKLIKENDDQQKELDIILKKTSFIEEDEHISKNDAEEEENLLYFIMKNSPNLESWKREILRIVYKVNQYFYPQGQTKNLNEGYASFCHYYIMTRLEEKGILSPDAYMSFLTLHAGVIFQPDYNSKYYSGINPYALGFAILMDVKRMCENPTVEDAEWFPWLMGRDWQDAIKEASFEHRDDSFIMQYLSPKVIRDLKLFSVNVNYSEDEDKNGAVVSDIHDDIGYKQVRINLARSCERINRVPQIIVVGADLEGDRILHLEYIPFNDRKLDRSSAAYIATEIDYLWGYVVDIFDGYDNVESD